jgi:hypothetical protein
MNVLLAIDYGNWLIICNFGTLPEKEKIQNPITIIQYSE